MSSGRKLVVVESPAKARTIAGYLGEGYEVQASIGHIRDLPQPSELPAELKKGPLGKFAVDVDNDFEPYYEVYADKKKKVAELKKALKDADELYLATDEDREGEAIAWHLLEALKPKVPVKRMVFHEITKEAINAALENTREVDQRLVDAQETRRILDRLYGYEVSPVLWRKVSQGLSAGRVQSVATRLVVERERERMAFVPASYWDVAGDFTVSSGNQNPFNAKLISLDETKIATGRDFGDDGQLKTKNLIALSQEQAEEVCQTFADATTVVDSLETKPYTRKPAPPFTTSTLQQEASRKLKLSSRQTMRIAQGLYENGYITYMRTDSPGLSEQAIQAARKQAEELYGSAAVASAPRIYATKSKGAQEAHEAIRPAGENFRRPQELQGVLNSEQHRLYDLIWKRTIASQMADAKGSTATVKLKLSSSVAASFKEAIFSAAGTVITAPGFLLAYEEGKDVSRYDNKQDDGQKDNRLPELSKGQSLEVAQLVASGHQTSPPPRYTEASLVKALEERGIGRPSTYASTISVIQDRGYVLSRGQALVPSWVAFSVVRLLETHFATLVDYDFTASMEADLDAIAAGSKERVAWLKDFYFGDEDHDGLQKLVSELGEIDARGINSVDLGEGLVVRVGRWGPYVEDSKAEVTEGVNPPRATIPTEIAPDELTVALARELLEKQNDDDIVLGSDPQTGNEIVAKAGRYGPYVTEVIEQPELPEGLSAAAKKRALADLPKPRSASLFKTQDLRTISLAEALQLLSLPRVLGVDPETGTEITAQNGRFGPYLKRGTDSRPLESEQQIFDITLEEALAIYAQPKTRGAARSSGPLRELGIDPTSEKPLVIKDGRFGPYITDGKTNRTLPKDFTIEGITFDDAVALIAEKRAKGPATRKTAAKKPASTSKKASAAKKAPAKRAATKKAAE